STRPLEGTKKERARRSERALEGEIGRFLQLGRVGLSARRDGLLGLGVAGLGIARLCVGGLGCALTVGGLAFNLGVGSLGHDRMGVARLGHGGLGSGLVDALVLDRIVH